MVFRLTIVLLLGALTGAPCTSVEAVRIPDDPNGFNGYVWGASRDQFPDLRHIKDFGATEAGEQLSLYEKPGEVVTLGGAALTGVRYRFLGEHLESILLPFEGRESRDKLLRWVEERYGKLTPPERRMLRQVEWHGDKTEVTLTFNHVTKEGVLLFASMALRERMFDSNLKGGGMP